MGNHLYINECPSCPGKPLEGQIQDRGDEPHDRGIHSEYVRSSLKGQKAIIDIWVIGYNQWMGH